MDRARDLHEIVLLSRAIRTHGTYTRDVDRH
jgi:hypothetical protein